MNVPPEPAGRTKQQLFSVTRSRRSGNNKNQSQIASALNEIQTDESQYLSVHQKPETHARVPHILAFRPQWVLQRGSERETNRVDAWIFSTPSSSMSSRKCRSKLIGTRQDLAAESKIDNDWWLTSVSLVSANHRLGFIYNLRVIFQAFERWNNCQQWITQHDEWFFTFCFSFHSRFPFVNTHQCLRSFYTNGVFIYLRISFAPNLKIIEINSK